MKPPFEIVHAFCTLIGVLTLNSKHMQTPKNSCPCKHSGCIQVYFLTTSKVMDGPDHLKPRFEILYRILTNKVVVELPIPGIFPEGVIAT